MYLKLLNYVITWAIRRGEEQANGMTGVVSNDVNVHNVLLKAWL